MLSRFDERVDAFADLLNQHDLPSLLHNAGADVSMEIVRSDGLSLPMSVCHHASNQTWLTSPLSMYADYTQEETSRHLPKYAAMPINAVLSVLKYGLERQHFARAVTLNNWLVSTNLYPKLNTSAVNAIMRDTLQRYPQHALWWRSLNELHHGDWLQYLKQQGCVLIPGRRIFLLSDLATQLQYHRDWQHDARLSRNTALQKLDNADFGSAQDYEQACDLYNQLYLGKYSQLNPQYTPLWIQGLHQHGLLHLQGYANSEGKLVGVAGSVRNEHTLTTPIFGFDTEVPQKMGLYRLNNHVATQYALAQGLNINMSAGAGQFKQHRGAVPYMEYSAVYVRHLPKAQQAAVHAARLLSQYIAAPMMQSLDM